MGTCRILADTVIRHFQCLSLGNTTVFNWLGSTDLSKMPASGLQSMRRGLRRQFCGCPHRLYVQPLALSHTSESTYWYLTIQATFDRVDVAIFLRRLTSHALRPGDQVIIGTERRGPSDVLWENNSRERKTASVMDGLLRCYGLYGASIAQFLEQTINMFDIAISIPLGKPSPRTPGIWTMNTTRS